MLLLPRSGGYLHSALASEPAADREPNDNDDHDDDGEDNKLHLHVLEPHLATKLLPLPLEVIGLETQVLGLVNKEFDLLSTVENLFNVVHHNTLDFGNLGFDFRNLVHFIGVINTILHMILQFGSKFFV